MTILNSKLGKVKIQEIFILAVLFLLPFYFIKFKYSWISLNLVEILVVALFFVWFFNKNTRYKIQDTRYNMPVLLILAGIVSSMLVNKNYYVGFGILKGWFVLPIIFAVILFHNLKKNEKLLHWTFAVVFCSGVFVSIEGIYYWLTGVLTYDGRLRIFFDSPNQLAMFLAPVFLIGVTKFGESLALRNPDVTSGGENPSFEKKSELWKLTGIVLGLILITFDLYLTKSFGAWMAIGLTLIIVFWLRYGNLWSKKILVSIVIFFILLITLASFSKFENIKNLGGRSSLASRVMIWKSAGLMIQKNPLFGIGPGNFQDKYLEYQKYFPPYLEWAVPQPHNLFLAFWLEAGFIGLVGFSWLLLILFMDIKKTRVNNPETSLLCLAIILYFLIHGLVDTTYWRNDMAVVFWAMMAANFYLAEDNRWNKSVHSNVNL